MPTHEDDYPQLLSLAVHEFRTPAGVVSGYLRMLQRDTDHPLSSRQSKMVGEAEKSCARIVALVGELSEIFPPHPPFCFAGSRAGDRCPAEACAGTR